jgi:2-hydroxy-3-keto-5-methylthiopentenyl-1-phosphate phosphatase
MYSEICCCEIVCQEVKIENDTIWFIFEVERQRFGCDCKWAKHILSRKLCLLSKSH